MEECEAYFHYQGNDQIFFLYCQRTTFNTLFVFVFDFFDIKVFVMDINLYEKNLYWSTFNHYNMKLRGILGLLLLSCVTYQQTAILSIYAIEPCTLNFTLNATETNNYNLSCTYFLPGANITYDNDTAGCWLSCCPGLAQPDNTTYQDFQSCASTYATQPFLVTLIGILLGILLLLVFVCIPCLCTKDGIFLCIKKGFFAEEPEELEINAGDMSPVRDVFRSTRDFELKMSEQLGSQHVLQEDPVRISLSEQIIDETPSETRLCVVCGEGKANLHLNCKHHFHSQCLLKTGELNKCQECSTDKIRPVKAYCCICERRYGHLNRVEPHNHYICRTCEEK